MEEALQPVTSRKSEQYFAIGIATSLGLHLVLSALLLGTPGAGSPPPAVSYVDLAMVRPAPEMTAPAKVPTTPPPAQKDPVPAQEPTPPESAAEPPATPAVAAAPATPAPQAAQAAPKEQLPQTSMGLGMAMGYFSSLGNGESLNENTREYYLEMLQRINERWWMDQDVDKKGVGQVLVTITVGRNGDIVDARLLRSSGNQNYDKAVLKSLSAAGPLPPLPASYQQDFFMAPIRLVPPLNLMALGNG